MVFKRTRTGGPMVAHNNHKDRDVFQIAPGVSRESLWLAYQAHIAAQTWNLSTEAWNRQPARLLWRFYRVDTAGTRHPHDLCHRERGWQRQYL